MILNNDKVLFNRLQNDQNKTTKGKEQYSFLKNSLNFQLVKILFLPLREKIDIYELQSKYKNINDEYLKKNFVSKSALFDNLINNSDYYSQSLKAFKESYYSLINYEQLDKIIEDNVNLLSKEVDDSFKSKIFKFIDEFESQEIKYIRGELDETSFGEEVYNTFSQCVVFLSDLAPITDLVKPNYMKQFYLYKVGFFYKVTGLIRSIQDIPLLKKILRDKDYYDKIMVQFIELIKIISYKNAFLQALNFNKPIINIIFGRKDKLDSSFQLRKEAVDYYNFCLKHLFEINYSLELEYLVDTLKTGIKKVNFIYKDNKRFN